MDHSDTVRLCGSLSEDVMWLYARCLQCLHTFNWVSEGIVSHCVAVLTLSD